MYINKFSDVQNITAYKLYKRNNASIDLPANKSASINMRDSDFVYISDYKRYNVYRIIPKFMAEIFDGIEFHLWENTPLQKYPGNVVTMKLLPDTKLWYIFDDRVYNISILILAIVIVAVIIFVTKYIKSTFSI
jgi:hypothetical protein